MSGCCPREYRRELLGWDGRSSTLQRQNPDLTNADVMRIQHMMGAESGAARRQMLEGVAVELDQLPRCPSWSSVPGSISCSRRPTAHRLAEWLGADYEPFGAHSHYGLIIGENSYEQVAEAVRAS